MGTGGWTQWVEERKNWKNGTVGNGNIFLVDKISWSGLCFVFLCLFSVYFLGLSLSFYTNF
jgi:hypothetical protein